MKWLRLYSSVARDPKVLALSDHLFRVWINLLCVANEHEPRGTLPPATTLVLLLHWRRNSCLQALESLCKAGLLDRRNGVYRLHHWDHFQYKSDNVTARTERSRERSRNVRRAFDGTQNERPQITDNRSQITDPRDRRKATAKKGEAAKHKSGPRTGALRREAAATPRKDDQT